jgi:trigger factor
MPAYFKNEEQKALFATAKTNDVITFCPAKAYEGSDAELAALLKIKKEETAQYQGNFSFQVNEISHFVAAELNQEFFDQVYGEGAVKSEEEFKNKVKENLQNQFVADSDYKFLLDVRAYLEEKVGQLEFPDEMLKKIMLANNADKGEDFVNENYDKSIVELKWHLIKEQLVKANDIKVNDEDVKKTAIQATRFQFAQYGMANIPDEYLEQYASEMLKKKEQVQGLVERCIDEKLTAALKNVVTLEHKSVTVEEFNKMFEKA